LVLEMFPHALWGLTVGPRAGVGFLILWIFAALVCWGLMGLLAGWAIPRIAPLRRVLLDPWLAKKVWYAQLTPGTTGPA
jgi:hypothetical protein